MEVGEEVVYSLRENSGPINRINSTEVVFLVEFLVGEERFDDILAAFGSVRIHPLMYGILYLAIVKCTLHSDVIHIWVGYGRHLSFLYRRNASFGM